MFNAIQLRGELSNCSVRGRSVAGIALTIAFEVCIECWHQSYFVLAHKTSAVQHRNSSDQRKASTSVVKASSDGNHRRLLHE